MTSERESTGPQPSASAFAVARRVLAGITLSVGQTGQLRAIDHKYQQSLYTMLEGARRAPTDAERSLLDDSAADDIMKMLTAEQRRALEARGEILPTCGSSGGAVDADR